MGAILGILAPILGDVFKRIFPDEEAARAAEAEVNKALIENAEVIQNAAARIVLAEARGGWLQRNWRPMLMLTAIGIIANNYILAPYVEAFGGTSIVLDLPSGPWSLLTVGVGGYVVGRSAEKILPHIGNKP